GPVAFENSIGMRFVLIPAGKFLMGSPEDERGRDTGNQRHPGDDDEKQHEVTLTKPFYMAIFETTNAQYRRFQPDHKSGEDFEADAQPAVMVSWDDATAFLAWLRTQDRAHEYRLPTDAEWEYACRARTTTRYEFGTTIMPENANYFSRGETKPVGTYPASSWGLYDMHGNVWEWCADWYGAHPSGAATDPAGPASGDNRVLRGGSWHSDPDLARSASRGWGAPTAHYTAIGFRVSASAAAR